MAAIWSPLVQYPINVAKDLLLIYNTNSLNSSNVCQYYLTHRPMVANANVLGIGCITSEAILPTDFATNFLVQVTNWLNIHPTKRPQYVVLFQDIPSRVNSNTNGGGAVFPGVQYQLSTDCATNWQPFVTSINMDGTGGTTDCIAYINKLASFGGTYSPGQLIITVPKSSYGNTNYYFDDTRIGYAAPPPPPGADAEAGVLSVNPSASVTYTNVTNDIGLIDHITSGLNLAGYLCWGEHSSLSNSYATNGTVKWTGTNSGWWLIRTVESYNGDRVTSQGNFLSWFAATAFGGTNYTNTPIAAVSYVDEPTEFGTIDGTFFGLWESGNTFAICAWNSQNTLAGNFYTQAVGDPFIAK
jgi:hypothetical protein